MLPRAAADELNRRGHDAISVYDVGLAGAEDARVFNRAVAESRVMVTENFADFSSLLSQRLGADEECVPVVFIRKTDLPTGGALAIHLADRLDNWATGNPRPYVGPHWP